MDYQSLEQFLQSQEAVYLATGIACTTMGYIAHAVFGRGSRKLKMAEAKRQTALAEKDREEIALERDKLRYEHAQSDLEIRSKEQEIQRKYEQEDHDRERKEEQEDSDRERRTEQEDHDRERKEEIEDRERELREKRAPAEEEHRRKIELAKELEGSRQVLQQYLDDLKASRAHGKSRDPDYLKQRADFQRGLVEETLKYLRDQDNGIGGYLKDNTELISQDEQEAIERAVDVAFPLEDKGKREEPEMPETLQTLIDGIFGEEE